MDISGWYDVPVLLIYCATTPFIEGNRGTLGKKKIYIYISLFICCAPWENCMISLGEARYSLSMFGKYNINPQAKSLQVSKNSFYLF